MWGVRKHIYGLHLDNLILFVQVLQVASLRGGIARYINDAVWGCTKNGFHYIWVHASTWRVGDDDIRTAVLCDEIVCEDVLHVSSIEQRVVDTVDLRVNLRVLDGFGHILDAYHLLGFLGYEVGDGAGTGIEVVNHLVAC